MKSASAFGVVLGWGLVVGCSQQNPYEAKAAIAPADQGVATILVLPAPPTAEASGVPSPSTSAHAPSGGPCLAGMTLMPAGTFAMGRADTSDEAPVHKVDVQAFCLDQTEVTVAAYDACVKAGRCSPAPATMKYSGYSEADLKFWGKSCNTDRSDRQDHPVNCVDFRQADAYCKAQGGRLPTEEEWEYAACGGDEQREYPWGSKLEPGPALLNACGGECARRMRSFGRSVKPMYPDDDGYPETAPVKSYDGGKGRWDVWDLAGNVTEWTDSFYCDYDKRKGCDTRYRVYRGLAWIHGHDSIKASWSRLRGEPTNRFSFLGFRCARTIG